MAKFRKLKSELRERLSGPDWRACLDEAAAAPEPQEYVGPFMALLPQPGILRWRGVSGLGLVVPRLAELRLEDARVVMRRFMWHMNEESGNLGWGIPESMGEVMARSGILAKEFGRVLFSYVLDSGREDNYIDYPPLLVWCFWGAGRLAGARPELWTQSPVSHLILKSFIDGLGHSHAPVRVQAALALARALGAAPDYAQRLEPAEAERARALLGGLHGEDAECEDFDGAAVLQHRAADLAARALGLLGA